MLEAVGVLRVCQAALPIRSNEGEVSIVERGAAPISSSVVADGRLTSEAGQVVVSKTDSVSSDASLAPELAAWLDGPCILREHRDVDQSIMRSRRSDGHRFEKAE